MSLEGDIEDVPSIEHDRERNWNAPRPKWGKKPDSFYLPTDKSEVSSLHRRNSNPSPASRIRANSQSKIDHGSHAEHSHHSAQASSSPSVSAHTTSAAAKVDPISLSARGDSPTPSEKAKPDVTSISHSPNGNGSPRKPPASGSKFGWQFPPRATLPPLDMNESDIERPSPAVHSPAPENRSATRSPIIFKGSHIPVRSEHLAKLHEKEHGQQHPGLNKGHRRSSTEFAQSKSHSHSAEENPFAVLAVEEGVDSVHGKWIYGIAFSEIDNWFIASDEEDPAPHLQLTSNGSQKSKTSETKVHRTPSHSDEESHLPSPSTPSNRALAPETQLITPPRRTPTTTPKLEFKTPSPPKNLPDLPGPPSSDEDLDQSLSRGLHGNVSLLKTPRPPGGWFATPKPDHGHGIGKTNSLPVEMFGSGESITTSSGLVTPVASLSRTSSYPPPRTPAPPGAWAVTPGTAARRSVLKVRFDVESDHSALDGAASQNGQESTSGSSFGNLDANSFPEVTPLPAIDVKAPLTPQSSPPTSLRKSPSLRLVDEYGEAKPEPVAESSKGKSAVRIVDAMGEPVEAITDTHPVTVKEEERNDEQFGHNEALRRIRQTVSDLASGLSDIEK